FQPDPACVHVDCAGPVREDVPGNGLLGEGLTGENDRLKSGLQRRTPTIPLRGLRSRGGGDRYVNSGNTNRVSVGRVRPALLRRGSRRVATYAPSANPRPPRPCELVECLSHLVGLGDSGPVQPCEAIPHLATSSPNSDGKAVPGARATESGDVSTGLEYPVARFGPFQ